MQTNFLYSILSISLSLIFILVEFPHPANSSNKEERKILSKDEFTPRPTKHLKLAIELYNTTRNTVSQMNVMIRHDPVDDDAYHIELATKLKKIEQEMEEYYESCKKNGPGTMKELELFLKNIDDELDKMDAVSAAVFPKVKENMERNEEYNEQLYNMLAKCLALKLKYTQHLEDLSIHGIYLYHDINKVKTNQERQQKINESVTFDLELLIELTKYYEELEGLEDKLYDYYVKGFENLEPDEITYGLTPLQVKVAKLEINIKSLLEDEKEKLFQFGSAVEYKTNLLHTKLEEVKKTHQNWVDSWGAAGRNLVEKQNKFASLKKKLLAMHKNKKTDSIDKDEL